MQINSLRTIQKELPLSRKNLNLRLYKTTIGDIPKENKQDVNIFKQQTKNLIPLHHLEIQFLIDTGAQCSLVNYDTFIQLRKHNPKLVLYASDTVLKAANDKKIEIIGMIYITLSYEQKAPEFLQKFWVYAKNNGKNNLLGIDFLHNQIKNVDIQNQQLSLKGDEFTYVQLHMKSDKNYPYVTKAYEIYVKETYIIKPETTKKIQLPLTNSMRVKKKTILFTPNKQSKSKKLLFCETALLGTNVQQNKDTERNTILPVMVINPTKKPITIRPGPIGYLTLDAHGTYKNRHKTNHTYSTNTYDTFVNEVNMHYPTEIEIPKAYTNESKIDTENYYLNTVDHFQSERLLVSDEDCDYIHQLYPYFVNEHKIENLDKPKTRLYPKLTPAEIILEEQTLEKTKKYTPSQQKF